ncbi:MAG TPA: hypothetical protein VM284_01400 [Candidatus Limnocylindria bacterium]|nr:hypothetical protein [Candidatus Limnocylindria bacterium]
MTDPAAPAPPPNPRVRDREVLVAAALVVAGVLLVAWLTGLIPVLDDAIGLAPLVIVGLVVVTLAVLGRALWPRR